MLAALPDTNLPATRTTTPACRSSRRTRTRPGGKVDVQLTPTLLAVRALRLPQSHDRRSAEHPAAIRRRRQRAHLRAQPAVRPRRRRGRRQGDRCSKRGSATRGRRRGRTRRRSGPTARSTSSGSRVCRPTAASPAGCRRSSITGYSDLGRQATNPQWQYPTVYNPKINYTWTRGAHSFKTGYEFQRINTEVQDVNPLYGRDTYNGSVHAPDRRRRRSNLYNLADFMLGLRAQYALSSVLVAHLRRNMQFAYLQDDWRASSRLTLNLGAALRVPRRRTGSATTSCRTSIRRRTRCVIAKDGSTCRSRARQPRPQQLRAASRLRLHRDARTRSSAAATASATCTSAAPAAATCCRSTGRRWSTRSSTRPTRAAPSFVPAEQGYPAGLADPSQFNPLTANITYMPQRLPLESGAELVHLRAARARSATCCSTSPTSATAQTTCCCSPTTTRRSPTTPPAPSRCRIARPNPALRRHHLRVQRRQVALQGAADEVRMADEPRRHAPELVDAVARRRTTDRSRSRTPTATTRRRRTSGTWTPTSACRTTTSRTTAPPASCGRCRSAVDVGGPATRRRLMRRAHRRLAARRHQLACTPASR